MLIFPSLDYIGLGGARIGFFERARNKDTRAGSFFRSIRALFLDAFFRISYAYLSDYAILCGPELSVFIMHFSYKLISLCNFFFARIIYGCIRVCRGKNATIFTWNIWCWQGFIFLGMLKRQYCTLYPESPMLFQWSHEYTIIQGRPIHLMDYLSFKKNVKSPVLSEIELQIG